MDIEAARGDEDALAQRAERDLQSFKAYIEERAQQVSGWQAGVSDPGAPGRPL